MQRLRNLWLLIGLISSGANAQIDSTVQPAVNEAAFKLTKATVEFLATDTKTFGKRPQTTCEGCTTYPSLLKFVSDNKLTKADELINDAQKQLTTLMTPNATKDQVLADLRNYLHDRVTKGDGRERRTTLPSYTAYQAKTAQIIGVGPEADLQAGLTSADTTETGESVGPLSAVTRAGVGGSFPMGEVALGLSLLNLLGLVYLWSQRRKSPASLTDAQFPELSKRVFDLETQRKELLTRISTIERGTGRTTMPDRSVAPAPTSAPTQPRPAQPQPVANPTADRPVEPKPVPVVPQSESPRPVQTATPVPPVTKPTPVLPPMPPTASSGQPQPPMNQPRRRETVLYGRTADLGDGFSVASLLETPDRDTVFQIDVRSDALATYRVSDEPGAQQLALSDPYSYLTDACEYLAKPSPNARIRTEQPGQLALQGDKWKIVEKAKISFY